MNSETLYLRPIIEFVKRKKLLFNETLEKKKRRKDSLLLANKLVEKIPNPHNVKEHYQPFIRKKNTKSVKQS